MFSYASATTSPPTTAPSTSEPTQITDKAGEVASAVVVTADQVLATALRIALIIVVALVLRWLINRAIKALTQRSIDGKMPVMLNPIRGRARRAIQAATGLLAERRKQRAETLRTLLRSVGTIFIGSIAIMLVLGELGINLAPILASAGIAGVALGFGAQNLIKDYLNGVAMILEDQYGVGDIVDLGEAVGTIEAVGLRTTRLRDAEGVVWYVRNGEIIRVANQSQGTATVIVDIPVAHGTDLDAAQATMTKALDHLAASELDAEAFLEPPSVLGVQSVSAVGITLRAILTVLPGERFRVARHAKREITQAFNRAGISAPSAPIAPTVTPGDPPA